MEKEIQARKVPNSLVGQLVISKAGRDKHQYYLIVSEPVKNVVMIANGRNWTIGRARRKNLRHLWVTKSKIVEIDRLLSQCERAINHSIASIIQALEYADMGLSM